MQQLHLGYIVIINSAEKKKKGTAGNFTKYQSAAKLFPRITYYLYIHCLVLYLSKT